MHNLFRRLLYTRTIPGIGKVIIQTGSLQKSQKSGIPFTHQSTEYRIIIIQNRTDNGILTVFCKNMINYIRNLNESILVNLNEFCVGFNIDNFLQYIHIFDV